MKRFKSYNFQTSNSPSIKLYFFNLTQLTENTKTLSHDYHSSDTEKGKGNKQVEQANQETFLLKMTKRINIVEPCCAVNPSSNKREVCK